MMVLMTKRFVLLLSCANAGKLYFVITDGGAK
jgi:hypothetical protein